MTRDRTEAHFDEEEGHLRIDCADEDFNRIRDLLLAEASMADRIGPFTDGIRCIVIRRSSALRDVTPERLGRGLRILFVAIALSLSLAIQVIGLVTISRWLWGRDS